MFEFLPIQRKEDKKVPETESKEGSKEQEVEFSGKKIDFESLIDEIHELEKEPEPDAVEIAKKVTRLKEGLCAKSKKENPDFQEKLIQWDVKYREDKILDNILKRVSNELGVGKVEDFLYDSVPAKIVVDLEMV